MTGTIIREGNRQFVKVKYSVDEDDVHFRQYPIPTSQSLEQRLEYGELSLEEENKLLREKINKMEGLTTSITRLEVINKDRGREKVVKSEDITLSFQDDFKTLKVFYGYGDLDELKHF